MVSSQRHRGYVLLTSLLLLLLVSAAMASACRLSLRQALVAQEAQRSLQLRWAAISCETALLPQAEMVLAAEQKRTNSPVVSCLKTVNLGGSDIQLLFADEQAKINAQSLLRRLGKSDAEISIRQLLSGTGLAGKVRLRPGTFNAPTTLPTALATTQGSQRQQLLTPQRPVSKSAAPAPTIEVALGSLGAVFDVVRPQDLIDSRYGLASAADRVTCWGNGRINWRRASESTLRLALSPPLDLNQIAKLLSQRSSFSDSSQPISQSRVLGGLDLTGPQQIAAGDQLSDGSECHSIWVIEPQSDQKSYRIYVQDQSSQPPRVLSFEW